MIFTYIIIGIALCYGLLVIYYWHSWRSVPVYVPGTLQPQTKISVIIPARNEEENIEALLQALEKQSYPSSQFEVIVIDDHSTDNTAAIVKQYPAVKLLQLTADNINSYKKKAIETGIAAASGELIVTTDADCVPPPTWLETIAAFKEETNAIFIAAPVAINFNSSVLQVFQAMDFMVLQGITGAVVHNNQLSMCNGANLSYEKDAFVAVNGFAGIDTIASGDDMLLMHKITTQFPGRVQYLKAKETIMTTAPMQTWPAFFNQRIRWASKAAKYNDKRIFPVLLLVYLFNLSFLVTAIAGFWNSYYWLLLLILWVYKTVAEFPLFSSVAGFFDKRWTLQFFFFFQPLHILYTIVSGFFGQMGNYEWKGRKVS